MNEETRQILILCITVVLCLGLMVSCEWHADSVGDPHGAVAHGLK